MGEEPNFLTIIPRHQRKPPVPVVRVARDLGLEVYRSGGWPDSVSGMIRRDAERGGASGYAIFSNGDHAVTRRRFTIAHEIGHFVLHRELIGDGLTDDALYRSRLQGGDEAAANRFAADLLMPWNRIREAVVGGMDTVEKLAVAFKVSHSAMSIRLGVPFETK